MGVIGNETYASAVQEATTSPQLYVFCVPHTEPCVLYRGYHSLAFSHYCGQCKQTE